MGNRALIECPACDGGREKIQNHCETCHSTGWIDKPQPSYRENAKVVDEISELPVAISPPPVVAPFWLISDGSAYRASQGGYTLEPEDACRFATRGEADNSFARLGAVGKRTMHILRVDCTATVVDETFNERNRRT